MGARACGENARMPFPLETRPSGKSTTGAREERSKAGRSDIRGAVGGEEKRPDRRKYIRVDGDRLRRPEEVGRRKDGENEKKRCSGIRGEWRLQRIRQGAEGGVGGG